MKRYEYKILNIVSFDNNSIIHYCNKEGKDGWRVVTKLNNNNLLLEREII